MITVQDILGGTVNGMLLLANCFVFSALADPAGVRMLCCDKNSLEDFEGDGLLDLEGVDLRAALAAIDFACGWILLAIMLQLGA